MSQSPWAFSVSYARILQERLLLCQVELAGFLAIELDNIESESQPDKTNPGAGVYTNPWVLNTAHLVIIGR